MTALFADAASMVAELQPENPVYCVRPHVLRDAARRFVSAFPGRVLYAVKCNAEPMFLDALHDGGVRDFDTASLVEVELIAGRYADAHRHFMHPVKRRAAIGQSYRRYGVRHFVVDHPDELDKIIGEIGVDPDVVILVRVATARGAAVYDLGGKFGCGIDEAATLLDAASERGYRVGICFHVGSQCLTPASYTAALRLVAEVLARTSARIGVLDVGGGFPSAYVGVSPPPLEDYIAAIRDGVAALNLPEECELWSEPGRALVAEGASLVVRVELRRDHQLYINDGVYGSLSDLNIPGIQFPMRALRPGGEFAPEVAPFSLFGPTCDTVDVMRGPYLLPADIREGDYIEIGQAGAYTTALRTRFNGFHADRFVEVTDDPFLPTPDMAVPQSLPRRAAE